MSEHADENDSNKIIYFIPGQLILQVKHLTTDDMGSLAENITNNFRQFLTNYLIPRNDGIAAYILDEITVIPEQIIPLIEEEGISQSLVQINVTDDWPLRDGMELNSQEANNRIIQIVEAAFEILGQEPFNTEGDITLESLSPNWTLSNSQGAFTGTGGPGSRPVPPALPFDGINPPFNFLIAEALNAATSAQRQTLNQIGGLIGESGNSIVDVIILDSVPSLEVDQIRILFPQHALIPRLCDQLTIHRYDINVDPPPVGADAIMEALNDDDFGTGIKGHNYVMSDHGLFIAGIVHSIIPNAQIHLIEVLNKRGVGTLDTIARGIRYALGLRGNQQEPEEGAPPVKRPLIVNCSFTINMPLPENRKVTKSGRIYKAHPHPELNWPLIDNSKSLVDYLKACVEFAFSPVLNDDILVVAAAGNDSKAGEDPLQSRLPAQLPHVIGIAALRRDLDPQGKYDYSESEYSNIADDPESDGIAVFGGNLGSNIARADAIDGVLGVYTGDFPNYSKPSPGDERYGWARWSGTSFATPIIAGVLALLRSKGSSAQTAKDTIEDAITEVPPGVQIFLVDQK